MRLLAIVSVLFAVTQVAFAAPASHAFHSDVFTRSLQHLRLQERRGFFDHLNNGAANLHEGHERVKNGIAALKGKPVEGHESEDESA
ncbi:hypothetical protein K439DRAFT_1633650 [Ramaria rubella]|nr:hypothetical protein K439DRAFT_1633650 [Ramaria rubella]